MLKIMCWLESEDYWNLSGMNEKDQAIDYYGYTFFIEDDTEKSGAPPVRVVVIELVNANFTVGFALPNNLQLDNQFQIGFICHDRPEDEIPFVCTLSEEVKKTKYNGDELQKLEYLGFSLEKFYEQKGVKFYLHDLRPPSS